MTRLNLAEFRPPPINRHYEGEYSPRMLRWREVCACDKVNNLSKLLAEQSATDISRVLEVGCGTGAVLLQVKNSGFGSEHYGVDIADPNEHPHPGVAEAGLHLSAISGEALPFPDKHFDLVYASHVLEHVPDERGFLTELKRVSKRWIFLEVPCEIIANATVSKLQRTLNIGHINAYTPETFVLTLATAGLPPTNVQLFDHSMDVHAFHSGLMKARLKATLRRSFLSANPIAASRVFSYHCGALIDLHAIA